MRGLRWFGVALPIHRRALRGGTHARVRIAAMGDGDDCLGECSSIGHSYFARRFLALELGEIAVDRGDVTLPLQMNPPAERVHAARFIQQDRQDSFLSCRETGEAPGVLAVELGRKTSGLAIAHAPP